MVQNFVRRCGPHRKKRDCPAPDGQMAAQSNAVTLERRLVETRDVPSDGACLFHALGSELKFVFSAAA